MSNNANTVGGQNTTTPSPTILEQLNELSEEWIYTDEFQEINPPEKIESLCAELAKEVEPEIDALKASTSFSGREAEVWVLSHTRNSNHVTLNTRAIAVYITSFHCPDEPVWTEDVEQYLNEAREKFEEAKQTIGQVTFPDRRAILNEPNIVWLSSATLINLQQAATADDQCVDDVVQRLIHQTKQVVDIEELVKGYLDDRGRDAVAQLAVESQSIQSETLRFIAYGGNPYQSLPDIVTDNDAVAVGDEVYDFSFRENAFGPQDSGRLTLYASHQIAGMDPLPAEQGIKDLKSAVTETATDIETLISLAKSRLNAVAVTAAINGDRIKVDVLRKDIEGRNTDRFAHIQLVTVGDEDLYAYVADQYQDNSSENGTIVWQRSEAEKGHAVPIESGIEALKAEMTDSDKQL